MHQDLQSSSTFDIVILPLPRWDGDYSSTIFSLAQEFSRTHRTFYLDNPFTFKDFIAQYGSDQIKKRKKGLISGKDWDLQLGDNLYNIQTPLVWPTNFLSHSIYPFFQTINNNRLSSRIRGLFRKYDIKRYIFINSFNPLYRPSFPKDNPPLHTIYHCVDNISESVYIKKHGTLLEDELVKSYDITITTSKELYRRKSRLTKSIHIVPNAANVAHFMKALNHLAKPSEIESVKGPIVTYVGNIEGRMDFDLLFNAIREHPDKTFLMIGPLNIPQEIEGSLKRLSNVILTGPKPFSKIPAYLKYSNCTIIPFKVNELTKSIYPLKINEYLATGKPVVSTAFSEDIGDFEGTIELAQSPADFSKRISKAISTDTYEAAENRIKIAKQNDWPGRAKDFLHIINENIAMTGKS